MKLLLDFNLSPKLIPLLAPMLRNEPIHITFRDAHVFRATFIARDELRPALLFQVLPNSVRRQFVGGAMLRFQPRS